MKTISEKEGIITALEGVTKDFFSTRVSRSLG